MKYVGSTAGDLWSVPANWLDENNTHRTPTTNDDIYIGAAAGTNTTDDLSIIAEYLDFYQGSNFLTISGGNQLVIFPSTSPGISVASGASAFITVTGPGSVLQLNGTASADGVALELDSGGKLSISSLSSSGASIGSLQGTSGTVDLGAKTLTVGGLNTFTNYNGIITGTGGSLTKVGTGALTLGDANTYSGATSINAGTLAINDNAGLGTSALTIGQTGSSNSATFTINTFGTINVANNITVSSLASGAAASINSFSGPSSGSNQLTGNVTLNGTVIVNTVAPAANPLAFTGTISGNGGVTINPTSAGYTGAVSFTGANTYNGNTTVNGGTLFANNSTGSATGNGSVIVNSGATLGGAGTMSGLVSVNSGASLAPGFNGTGILHVGNAALTTPSLLLGGTLSLELGGVTAGSGYDQVITATGATLSGNLTLTLVNGFRPMMGEKFYIIDETSSDPTLRTTGSFANAPGGVIMDNAGDTYDIFYAGISDPNNPSTIPNDVTLIAVNVVPEPSTWMLLLVGCASLVVGGLRRMRSVAGGKD
ncbi:MAG: autotransporter-associated beta strand repeat-containing protein [Verrucomicrobia bacterium]|nr:autotransporter-associated beta strand repeat-containing protein [Verrucomicrobiota bacterium]